jgi:DNA polymerase-3 subunit delta'
MLAKTNSKAELINKDLKPIIDKFVPLLNVNTIVRLMDIVYKQLRIAKSRGNKNLIWYNLLIGLEEVYNWSQ